MSLSLASVLKIVTRDGFLLPTRTRTKGTLTLYSAGFLQKWEATLCSIGLQAARTSVITVLIVSQAVDSQIELLLISGSTLNTQEMAVNQEHAQRPWQLFPCT